MTVRQIETEPLAGRAIDPRATAVMEIEMARAQEATVSEVIDRRETVRRATAAMEIEMARAQEPIVSAVIVPRAIDRRVTVVPWATVRRWIEPIVPSARSVRRLPHPANRFWTKPRRNRLPEERKSR